MKILSEAYILCYFIQDHHTWCAGTSWDGVVMGTITRSLWPTFWKSKSNILQYKWC